MREELERVAVSPVRVGEGQEVAALGGAGIVQQDVEAYRNIVLETWPEEGGALLRLAPTSRNS